MRFLPFLSVLIGLTACDASNEAPETPEAAHDVNHLARGLQAEPGTLDPHKSIMTDEWAVLRDVYMGLTYPGPDGRPRPGLADSWTVSNDGYTYIFSLRPNTLWSNAEPLNADDFVRGFHRLFDPETASPAAPLLYVIENARAVNSGRLPLDSLGVSSPGLHTVRIQLERPAPNLPEMLAMPFAAPHPEESNTILYNGPFVVENRVAGSLIRLVRNPNVISAYQSKLDRVSYFPLSDDESALRQYQSGQLDLHPWYPSDRRDWLDKNYPDQAVSAPALGVSYLVFNTEQAPFDRPDIRRALALAVDSNLLAERVLNNAVDAASRFVPTAVSDYAGPQRDQRSQQDRVAEARQLMRDAGYTQDSPLQFEFRVRQTPDDRKVATALQALWREIHAEASLITTDLKTHFDDLESGQFAIADAGWALFNAPDSFLFLLSEEGAAQLNYGRYKNPAFETAFRSALKATQPSIRAKLFADAEDIAISDAAVVPLFHYRVRAVIRPEIDGFIANPGAINPSTHLKKSAD